MSNGKLIARALVGVIGGTPKIVRYYDNNETSNIDMYIGIDRPEAGISTYSTIGLSNHSIGMKTDDGKQLRVEFIGACGSNADQFANIISSCAFNIINSKYSCEPGVVYPCVVKEYYRDIDMEHIFFTTPFLWENLHDMVLDEMVVTWLMAIPISDNEFIYLKENGSEALEDLFEENNIDIFDITRKSLL